MTTQAETQITQQPQEPDEAQLSHRKGSLSIFDPKIIRQAIADSFKKLDPRIQARNPVMFVVEVAAPSRPSNSCACCLQLQPELSRAKL
jgi:K+-transporting ATPase ATPase B chain